MLLCILEILLSFHYRNTNSPRLYEACGLGFSSLLTFALSVAGQPKSIQEAISTILGPRCIQLLMRKINFRKQPDSLKALEISRFFLGCPYYTAITSSPSRMPRMRRFSSSAAVALLRQTTRLLQRAGSLSVSTSVLPVSI